MLQCIIECKWLHWPFVLFAQVALGAAQCGEHEACSVGKGGISLLQKSREPSVNRVNLAHETQSSTQRVAVILKGEAFRSKTPGGYENGYRNQLGEHIRSTCGPESVESQRTTADNHIRLLEKLAEQGFDVELFGMTYNCTNGEHLANTLPELYASRFQRFDIVSERNTTQYTSIIRSLDMARNSSSDFDFYVLLRWDYSYPLDNACFMTLFESDEAKDLQWIMNGKANTDGLIVVPGSKYDTFMKFLLAYEPGVTTGCCPTRCPVACNLCVSHFLQWSGNVVEIPSGFDSPMSSCAANLSPSLLDVQMEFDPVPEYMVYDQSCIDCIEGDSDGDGADCVHK